MILESIEVIETSKCAAVEGKFKAVTQLNVVGKKTLPTKTVIVSSPIISIAPMVLTTTEIPEVIELLPYLNAVLEHPIYMQTANSIKWKLGNVGITIIDDQVRVSKYVNQTELYEILDMVKDIINDTYEHKAEITPDYTVRKQVPVLKIYKHLPKTNCKRCAAGTCMAFADLLNKFEHDIEDCPTIMEPEYAENRAQLTRLFEES